MSETVFGGIYVILLKVSQLTCLFLGNVLACCLCFRFAWWYLQRQTAVFSALCLRRNALFSILSCLFCKFWQLEQTVWASKRVVLPPKKRSSNIIQSLPCFILSGKCFWDLPFLGRSLLQNFSFEGPLTDHSLKFHRQTFTRENVWGRLAENNGPLKKAEPTWKCFFCKPCAIHKQQNIQKNRYCIHHLVFQPTCLAAYFLLLFHVPSHPNLCDSAFFEICPAKKNTYIYQVKPVIERKQLSSVAYHLN